MQTGFTIISDQIGPQNTNKQQDSHDQVILRLQEHQQQANTHSWTVYIWGCHQIVIRNLNCRTKMVTMVTSAALQHIPSLSHTLLSFN